MGCVRVAMLVRGLVLALALLGPGGCGAAGPQTQDACGVPAQIFIEGVPDLPGSLLGQTDRCAEGGTRIQVVEPALIGEGGVRLVAHELAHAAGHSEHLTDPGCILYPTIFDSLPPPCAEELQFLAAVQGPLYVSTSIQPTTVVADAIAYWNGYLQRALFVLDAP